MDLVEGDRMVLRTIAEAAEEHLEVALLGACAGHPDPGLWHRDDKADPDYSPEDTRLAVTICRSCPIQQWCEATFDSEPHGVFAGRTAAARAQRRSRLKNAEAVRAGNRERQRRRRRAATGG